MGDPLIYAGAEVSATFKTKQSGIRHASSGMMQLQANPSSILADSDG
jgi:hypothetical protein